MKELFERRSAQVVLFVHLLLLFIVMREPPLSFAKEKKKSVSVQTVTVKKPPPPKPKPRVVQAKPKPKPAPKHKVESKPKPKPKPTKKVVKKKPVEKQDDSKKKQALAKARESLAKISELPDKMESPPEAEVEAPLPKLSIDRSSIASTKKEDGYRDELARRLRLLLRLPEYGTVKVRLTVKNNGSVSAVEIISAASEVNRAYIQATLPSLSFSSFRGEESERSFALTLENER